MQGLLELNVTCAKRAISYKKTRQMNAFPAPEEPLATFPIPKGNVYYALLTATLVEPLGITLKSLS